MAPVCKFKALPRLVKDGRRSVGKKENILFIISVVLLNDDSEAGEKVEIVKFTIISKIYYKSTKPTGVR